MRTKLLLSLLIGAIVGALFGLVESVVQLVQVPWWPLNTPTIPMAMVMYGLLNALVTGLWGLAVWRRMDQQAFQLRTLIFSLLTMTYGLGGYYINSLWFPRLLALSSLLFTGCWTLAWLIGIWVLLKVRVVPSPPIPPKSGWIRRLAFAMLGLAVVAILSLIPPRLWIRSHQVRSAQTMPGGAPRPNVLLIVMDTARVDRLSGYGYQRKTTPNLDRLTQEGVLFEHASSTAPWTLPSHASLFTGLYPTQHRAEQSHPRLDDQLLTLAELMQHHGFQTAGFSNNPWVSRKMNFNQGFEYFKDTWLRRGGSRIVNQIAIMNIVERLAGMVTRSRDDGADFTNRHIRWWFRTMFNPHRAFFLFINYREPHFPYRPPEPYRTRFLRHINHQVEKARHVTTVRRLASGSQPAPLIHFDQTTREVLNDLYDAEIAYLDAKIGELVEELRDRQLLDNTVVIVTSDHGENIGDHELFGHQFCSYETLLHVPLIVRYPRAFPSGMSVAQRVSLVDVMPTLIELLDLETSTIQVALPGQSWVGSSLAVPRERGILAEYAAPLGKLPEYEKGTQPVDKRYFTRDLKSLYSRGLKFIWASDGRHELYDLSQDPEETQNLSLQFPDKARALAAELQQRLATMEPIGRPEAVESMDEATHHELRALGYLQ